MSLRLGFDIDGVLADFRSAFRTRRASVSGTRPSATTGKDGNSPCRSASRTSPRCGPTSRGRRTGGCRCRRTSRPRSRGSSLARASGWEVFFLTKRPPSAGDPVQFQTQWWLEQQGFYLPAVLTVPGSRGELANALRLDLVVDDQIVNCAEIIGAGPTKTMLMLRDPDPTLAEARHRPRHRRRDLPRRGAAGRRAPAGDLPTRVGKPLAPDGLVPEEARRAAAAQSEDREAAAA